MDGNNHMPPVSPELLSRLRRLMGHYFSSMADVIELIYDGPGLTVWTINEANREEYGFAGKIKDLPQALVVTGSVNLRNFTCSREHFSNDDGGRWSENYRQAARVAHLAGPWVRILAQSRVEQRRLHPDALQTAFNCRLAAFAALADETNSPAAFDPDKLRRLPPDYSVRLREKLEAWNLPEQLAKCSGFLPPSAPPVDTELLEEEWCGFVFETALRLGGAKLPEPAAIEAFCARSEPWTRLDDEIRAAVLENCRCLAPAKAKKTNGAG